MRPYISATLAVLSLLAVLALTFLLVASFSHVSFYPLHLGPLGLLFRSNHGILFITAFSSADWLPIASPIDWNYSFLGFGLLRQTVKGSAYTLFFPNAFLVLILLIHPYLFFRHTTIWLSRRRQRLALGQCPMCSYDLRMHQPGDRCPECGTPIQSTPPV